MSKFVVEALPATKLHLGEGPHWNDKNNTLYYVDIYGKSVHSFKPTTGEEYKVTIQEKGEGHDSVSLVIPVENNANKYVVGHGRSLRVLEWDGKSENPTNLKTIHTVNDGNPEGRFNDGKCDAIGRLWAGTMGLEKVPGGKSETTGCLYKLEKNLEISNHVDQIDIANGLAWSSDNKYFYYIDTLSFRVDVFDYDFNQGTISNRRSAFNFKDNNQSGYPDGMCIDATGNLWVAVYDGKKVLHIDPTVGKLIDQIDFPTPNITSVTFGGPNLDILYATSAKNGLSKEQLAADSLAGSLFQITNTGAKGLSAGVGFGGIL